MSGSGRIHSDAPPFAKVSGAVGRLGSDRFEARIALIDVDGRILAARTLTTLLPGVVPSFAARGEVALARFVLIALTLRLHAASSALVAGARWQVQRDDRGAGGVPSLV